MKKPVRTFHANLVKLIKDTAPSTFEEWYTVTLDLHDAADSVTMEMVKLLDKARKPDGD